jgi:formylglycine-generating enzyme
MTDTPEKPAPTKKPPPMTAKPPPLKPEWVPIPGRNLKMLKTEVTVKQYKKCVDAGKCTGIETGEYLNGDKSGRGNHPINGVTWFQARDFCKWSGGRLPTDKEWEYAATSGGKEHDYPWGNEKPTCDLAVFDDGGGMGCGKDRTWPVCSKPRENTEQGLCDMAGNVPEWTDTAHPPHLRAYVPSQWLRTVRR